MAGDHGLGGDDPLNGYRGGAVSETDATEDEVRALHRMEHADTEEELLRAVIASNELVDALNKDGPMKSLALVVTGKLDQAVKRWEEVADPTSTTALNAHREARAARMVLNWIENVILNGTVAQTQLNVMMEEEQYDD